MTTLAAAHSMRKARQWRRYQSYEPVDIEWLPEMPSHWKLKRLKFVAHLQTGLTLGKDYAGQETFTRPYLRVANVQDGYLDMETITQVSVPIEAVKRHELRPGDVLMTEGGDYDKLGRGFVWEGQIAGCLHQNHIFSVRPNKKMLEPRFLASLITSSHGKNYFTSTSQQTTNLASTNSGKIRSFPLPLPPLAEQRQILSSLDEQTTKIEALIVKKQRLIELLQEKRTALINHAVTKGLGPNVPMKESGVPWLGQVPEHWSGRKIKHLFRFTKRQDHPDLTVLSVYRDHGVLEKSSRDDNHNRTPEDLTTYQLVNVGDLVINKMKAWQGSLGVATLTGITSPDYVVYESQNNENLRFIHHLLRTPLMASTYHTISNGIRPDQWRLEPEKFELLWVYLPPKEEQRRIVCVIEEETKRIDLLAQKVIEGIERLREYRTALISAAVTGKIDVREEVD